MSDSTFRQRGGLGIVHVAVQKTMMDVANGVDLHLTRSKLEPAIVLWKEQSHSLGLAAVYTILAEAAFSLGNYQQALEDIVIALCINHLESTLAVQGIIPTAKQISTINQHSFGKKQYQSVLHDYKILAENKSGKFSILAVSKISNFDSNLARAFELLGFLALVNDLIG